MKRTFGGREEEEGELLQNTKCKFDSMLEQLCLVHLCVQ